jgi:hypothetical protein
MYGKRFTVEYNKRSKNTEADELAKVAARKAALKPDVFFQTIKDPSVKIVQPEPRMVNIIEGEDWQAPIMAYLHHHYEPDNNTELLRMQQRAKAYQVIRDELYKTLVTGPLLCCLSRDEGKELLAQTHSGIGGSYIGSRALIAKVFRQGFYWPSIIDDASKLVTTCQACRKFSPKSRAPSQPTQLITPSLLLQSSGGRIFYQVDRGETSSEHCSGRAQKIFSGRT